MKTLAYLFNNFNSPIIHIDEACRRKSSPNLAEKWDKWEYYDVAQLRPMFAVCRDGKSSYSYKNNHGNIGHGRGSKGLAHELVQQYFCYLENEWTFVLFKKEFTIQIERIEDEFHFQSNDRDYYIDTVIFLKEDCPFYDTFNGMIGIEATDTSATPTRKKAAFRRENINVLELRLIKDWHIDNGTILEGKDVALLRSRIKNFISKKPRVGYLNLTTKLV